MSALFGKITVVPRPGPPPPLPKLSDPNVQDAANEARLTSPTLQWFSLVLDDDRLNAIPRVKSWLDTASLTMYALFNSPRHNFASQTQEFYEDLVVIGTAVMSAIESPKSGVLFSTRHLKECVFFENDEDQL